MAKISDDTMRELEDILNGSETYADRLTAFLKLKTAPKPQANSNQFVLGGFDVSFDLDVDLVKLPPKPQPKNASEKCQAIKEPALRESTNNLKTANEAERVAATLPPPPPANAPTSPFRENLQPSGSPGLSPKRSLRRSGGIPGSDRLRRVAIQRRSRSCGRRDLLREFNDAVQKSSNSQEETNSTSNANTLNFIPGISSTPAAETQVTKNVTTAVATETDQDVGVSFKYSQRREEVPVALTSQRSTNSLNGTVQRTYTVEMGPEPGQLLLSPSRKGNNSHLILSPRNSVKQHMPVKHSPARTEILAPETPPRRMTQSQPPPEFTVPETQPQEDDIQQQVLQTLTSSPKAVPFVVVPITCLSPKASNQIEDQLKVETPKVASRSMQTSGNSRYVQNIEEILTDDDSDEQQESSSVPLNLAPPGGNTTRQSRLKKRRQSVKSPNLLLDLHRTRLNNSQRRQTSRQTVLNKPPKPPINGEKFAQELARMSNYEILDLRKRNSRGKLNPLNGRRQQLKEQQNIEECIEWELMRRNLDNLSPKKSIPKVPLPTASPCANSPSNSTMKSSLRQSPAAPPAGFRDKSVRAQRLIGELKKSTPLDDTQDNSMEISRHQKSKQRRRRNKRHEPSMSEDELLAVCTPPAQFRRSRYRQEVEPSTTLLAEPPAEFRRSKSQLNSSASLKRKNLWNQHQAEAVELNDDAQAQLRKSKSRHLEESNKTILAEPPPDFRSKLRYRIEDDESDEVATSEPPVQLRKSKSRHKAHFEDEENNETVLPDPPEQFRKSKSKNTSEVVLNADALQKSRRYRSRQRIEDDDSDNAEPPAQLRKSKSVHLEQKVVEAIETLLPDHPEQIRKSKSRHYELLEVVESNAHLEQSKVTHFEQLDIVETLEVEKAIECALPSPPAKFKRHTSRLRIEDDNSDDAALPDSPGQLQKSKSNNANKLNIIESNLSDLPKQLSKSKPMLKKSTAADLDATQLTDSPTQLQRSMVREKQLVAPQANATAIEMPPLQYVDEVRSNDEDDGAQTMVKSPPRSINNLSQISSQKELTAPLLPIETDLDEQPSTSQSARLNASNNRRKGRAEKADDMKENQALPVDDDVFKKPLAPAPRSKHTRKSKKEKELENLRINLPIQLPEESADQSVGDPNTTGVRKSKRGHVPLRNTWVHTQSDPFFFMRKLIDRHHYDPPRKPKKQSHTNKSDLLMERPPLSSSTPRNEVPKVTSNDNSTGKRKRIRQTEQISGISTLSSIAEQSEEQSIVEPVAEPEQPQQISIKKKVKRGRPKKVNIIDPVPPVDAASQSQTEPEVNCESALECQPTIQSINPPQNLSFPLEWLRDLNNEPIPKDKSDDQEYKSMNLSRASNLQYSAINGMDYAFYGACDNSLGYMRFKPFQARGLNKAKSKMQQMVVLYGQFEVEIFDEGSKEGEFSERVTLNSGDFVQMKIGTRYNIRNRLDEASILLINRK
ncbi:hypothetical protein KR093_000877 [Drosophila rubida]|uniref:Uncharacterized protein n=1 Tax=Drosophila rubida TaxID=30044 RepID=A0AAD4JRY6_9MUSC|nr:hypothetical protein KR093_000877 [Drosophila rubida]